MTCLLDVIAWPVFLMGGTVLFIVVGGILLCASTVALLAVMWKRYREVSKKKEPEIISEVSEKEEQ